MSADDCFNDNNIIMLVFSSYCTSDEKFLNRVFFLFFSENISHGYYCKCNNKIIKVIIK